jgi:hypothetical protein
MKGWRNEAVATDNVFSDNPAVDSGVKAAKIFIGHTSVLADVYSLNTDNEFVNTLDNPISDCASAERRTRIKNILHALVISEWQSEPYKENQNFSENQYATIKADTNRVMNLSGAPPECWLLALMYVCYVLKLLASASLGWILLLQALSGQMQDTMALFLC